MSLIFGADRPNDNTFVTREKIAKAEKLTVLPFGNGNARDIIIHVTFREVEFNGKKFSPDIYVLGNFKKDAEGRVTGWGSAFKIRNLFNAAGIAGMVDDDGNISESLVSSLEGCEIYIIKYCYRDGEKKKFKAWTETFAGIDMNEPIAHLKKEFFASVSKGFPRDFVHPKIEGVENDITDIDNPAAENIPADVDW
jgi:hypothetical protein